MWLRTREIKPGIHETQSFGFYAWVKVLTGAGIVLGLFTVGFGLLCLAYIGYFVVQGDFETAGKTAIAAALILGVAGWHLRHRIKHPREARTPGPWDGTL